MNRDDIIRMAREVLLIDFRDDVKSDGMVQFIGTLADFAALAAAAEREACARLLADMREKSRNHLFRSALTCAEGEIRAMSKP